MSFEDEHGMGIKKGAGLKGAIGRAMFGKKMKGKKGAKKC